MDDPNMTDFYGRVSRIQKARAMGHGFEAPGTLGRSYYAQRPMRRRAILGPVFFLFLCALLLKGAIYNQIGADSYNSRVAALNAGDGVERVGGWLMQEEGATILVSNAITWGLGKLK